MGSLNRQEVTPLVAARHLQSVYGHHAEHSLLSFLKSGSMFPPPLHSLPEQVVERVLIPHRLVRLNDADPLLHKIKGLLAEHHDACRKAWADDEQKVGRMWVESHLVSWMVYQNKCRLQWGLETSTTLYAHQNQLRNPLAARYVQRRAETDSSAVVAPKPESWPPCLGPPTHEREPRELPVGRCLISQPGHDPLLHPPMLAADAACGQISRLSSGTVLLRWSLEVKQSACAQGRDQQTQELRAHQEKGRTASQSAPPHALHTSKAQEHITEYSSRSWNF